MFSTFGAVMAGGMAGGLYPTDTPETAAFKVAHSGVAWWWGFLVDVQMGFVVQWSQWEFCGF